MWLTLNTYAEACIRWSHSSRTAVVSFSGSQGLPDYFYNVHLYPRMFDPFLPDWKPADDVWIHTGFEVQFESVRGMLYEVLGDLIGNKRGATVVSTGHSLGAALATLLTFELK